MKTFEIENCTGVTLTDDNNKRIDCSSIEVEADDEFDALAEFHKQYASCYDIGVVFDNFCAMEK